MISLDVYFKNEEHTGEIFGGQLIEQLMAKEALSISDDIADMGRYTEIVIPYHAIDIAVISRSYEPITVSDDNCLPGCPGVDLFWRINEDDGQFDGETQLDPDMIIYAVDYDDNMVDIINIVTDIPGLVIEEGTNELGETYWFVSACPLVEAHGTITVSLAGCNISQPVYTVPNY